MNDTTNTPNVREQKGHLIAQTNRIIRTEKGWKVPSQSGKGFYMVISNGQGATCDCPDHELRQSKCKHIFAVEFIITGSISEHGEVTVDTVQKKTYPQNWKAYNAAQQSEKRMFMELLSDITSRIQNPAYKFGRPTMPFSDMVYATVLKTYCCFSGRRFTSDLKSAEEKELLEKAAHFNTIFNYLRKKELTPILCNMVTLTSLPLTTVEHDFAIDSTGFGTSNFQRWFSFKHGREISSRKWVKCHFVTGVKTNTITSVKITTELDNDAPQLPELVQATAENFDMKELSADKAYLSKDNLQVVHDLGASPFIPFKTNNQPNGNGMLWKKLYHYFQLNNEDFLAHYHKRSNAESTVFMVKAKFGDSVRSKDWTAQVNEVLCKVIAHNICVIVQEMHELGLQPNFCTISPRPAQQVAL